MKREQLTNVTTESIDQRCNMLAWESMAFSQALVDLRRSPQGKNQVAAENGMSYVVSAANAIIALRTMHALGDLTIPAAERGAIAGTLRAQQVTP